MNSSSLNTSSEQIVRYTLKSNQSILFDDPSTLWLLRKGHIEVLSSIIQNQVPSGLRRNVLSITPQKAMFSCLPKEEQGYLGLMGIATENCEIEEIKLDYFLSSAASNPSPKHAIDTWVMEIGHLMSRNYELPAALMQIASKEERAYAESFMDEQSNNVITPTAIFEYGRGEFLAFGDHHSRIIRVQSGEIRTLGREDLQFTANDGYLSTCTELWFQVISDALTIEIYDLSPSNAQTLLPEGLANLHNLFNLYLKRLGEEEAEAEILRRKSSKIQEALRAAAAFDELSSILNPKERFPERETPLLTAVAIVGQSIGISVYPPAASEDMNRINDPLEAIARASRVRSRVVLLENDWWKSDSGPLVGYLGEEERLPIALLPYKNSYCFVNPHRRIREPLTEDILQNLCPDAFMLYRPLPEKVNGVFGLMKFTAQGNVGDMLFILLMGICATLIGMVVPKATGLLVDTAIPSADRQFLYELGIILVGSGIANTLFTYAQVMGTVRTGVLAESTAQAGLWDRLLKFRPDFYRQYSSGDLQTRVNAVSDISRELSGATLRPLISGILALLNFLLLWYYSWELAKIAIWIGLAVLTISLVVGHYIRRLSLHLNDIEGAFNGLMIQMIGGVGKIRIAGSEYRAFNHWVTTYTQKLRLTLSVQLLKDFMSIVNLAFPTVASAFLFWTAVDLTVGLAITDPKRISIGDFIAFNTAFTLYLTGWTDVSNTIVSVLDQLIKGRRIMPLLDGEPEITQDSSDPGKLTGAIRMENVCFRYAKDGPLILDHVSFEIHPGEYVAFVGPSGSGKSTILRLLLGFERPESGRVLYDGQDLASLDVLAVRRQLGTVLQNGRLNAGNILENISNNAKISHAEAWDAAADAALTEDIEHMPMGLHTMVSEGGSNMSGGQRQRLLIARALVTRPKIVMFDEATSALDNKTQATVSEALVRRRVTRVVIAHRLSTIRSANRVYVLKQGKVEQQGSFDELSQTPGTFKDLMARQMA